MPGFEPESEAWEASVLTTGLHSHNPWYPIQLLMDYILTIDGRMIILLLNKIIYQQVNQHPSPRTVEMMKYHITMLCGGESMMLSPLKRPKFDIMSVSNELGGGVLRASKDMVEFMHDGVKLTLYPNASLLFYHFTDLEIANSYADEIMAILEGGCKG